MKCFAATALLTALILTALPRPLAAQGSEPPPAPPADWGPMSINVEDVPYPHPVKFHDFVLQGHDVRMAYMDVAPTGTPNNKSIILLHGNNFFAESWTETIDILRKEGYRVIAIDQIGYGRSSKPIIPYSISTPPRIRRGCSMRSVSGSPTSSRTRWAAWSAAALPRSIPTPWAISR